LPDSGSAFRRNAPLFAAHLSSLLTRTVTDQPLVCRFHEEEGVVSAFIRFKGRTRRERIVTLGNGCRIYVFQRLLPHPRDPRKVTTAESSYSYGVGQNLEDDWLIRYDYVPERAEKDPEYRYPVGHVHFPTRRVSLEDFLEHLVVEMKVPTRRGQAKTLELLAESRRRFETEKRTRD
jgi:hypothetical protein